MAVITGHTTVYCHYRERGVKTKNLPKRNPSKRCTISLLIGILALICTALADAQSAPPLEAITLQLRWHHQFQFSGYYAAIEKGYYLKAGLAVTLKEGGSGKNTIEEVLNKRADYGVTNSEVLLHRLQHKPIVVLAAIFQHSPLVFITRKDTGITHPQDFIGRRLVMSLESRDIELHAVLKNEGIALDQIQLLKSWAAPEDYLDTRFDALSAYLTNQPYFLEKKKIPYSIIHPVTYGIDFYGDCLFTSQRELTNQPDRVKAFRQASLEGWRYAMAHPEEIIEVILSKYRTAKSREHLRFEAGSMRKLILPDLVEIGHMNPGRWRHIADTFVRFNLVEPEYDLNGFLYNPNPAKDYRWVRWIAGILFLFSFAVAVISISLFVFNKKLQREIQVRKDSESALKASEEKFRLLFDHTDMLVSVYNADGICQLMNKKVADNFNAPPEALVGKSILELHPTSGSQYLGRIQQVIENNISADYEDVAQFPAGRRHLLSNVHPVEDATGNVVAAQIISQDFTDRKTAEEELRKSEQKLKAIFEASPDPMVVYDPAGNPLFLNRAFNKTFGWILEDIQGAKIPFVPESQVQITSDKIKELYETEKPLSFETQRYTSEGRLLDIIVSAALIRDESDRRPVGMVVNLSDITERKQLAAQFQAAQRMESLGTLAGGIAHDFNNLLMGIQGRSSLMLADTSTNRTMREHLGGIEAYVKSATDLTRQLLGFARGGKYEVKATDLNELVKKQNRMFGRTRKEISIRGDYAKDLSTVEVDRGQIEQVLLNLYVNAWQAMPGGGRIAVKTRNATLLGDQARAHALEPGPYAHVSITDTGVGMDDNTRQRIFDPFFTTKEKGRGTGLGLASAYGIIKNHEGSITVSSRPGVGTTFDIFLPAATSEVTPDTQTDTGIVKGVGTVLLVDDEEMIIEVGTQMLELIGYRVITSRNGRETLKTYQANRDRIDVVILDMIMPDMDGGQTYDCLKEIDPDVKVVLSSGYSIDGKATDILNRGCSGFIQKPFNLKALSTKLAEVV